MINLRDYQSASIDALRAGVRSGHKRQLLSAPTGSGKCLGLGTPVLCYDGNIVPVEKIKVGDLLMGPDSEPRRVLSVSLGSEMLYQVIPTKGDPYVVNESHILSLKMTGGSLRSCAINDGAIVNLSVLDYLKKNKTFRHCAKGWRAAITFSAASLPADLPPYVLGLWLGDGSSRAPTITTMDKEIEVTWRRWATALSLQCLSDEQPNRCPSYRITTGIRGGTLARKKENRALEALRAQGLLMNKHIPHIYKTASERDRLDLLAGIVDTDGHLASGYYDLIFKQRALASDVAFVARSLGFAAYIKECRKTATQTQATGTYWRVSISGNVRRIPCRLLRKRASERKINKSALLVGIKVKKLSVGPYAGFTLDGDGLFLLGDFTVTHNTEIAMTLTQEALAKGSRTAFICDRLAILDQTSARFDAHDIPHGVIQAGHWRFRPHEPAQICSAQTLARRGVVEGLKLIIVDEAHTRSKAIESFIMAHPDIVTVGLTATPFTKGLGEIYSNVVNVTTTNKLTGDEYLAPLRVFAAKTIDMKGAKVKSTGEWEEREMERRGLEIVGDVVQEWITKCDELFAKRVKTIVFSATVAHGAELCRQWANAGYNFQQVSYKDGNDQYRKDLIEEFRAEDSEIDGLVSCEALAKGFDVPGILFGVSCRPYRKSLSGHIQQIGRVLRSYPGKTFAAWNCHSGNFLRFYDDTMTFFEHGLQGLAADRLDSTARKEPEESEKREILCVKCKYVLSPGAELCPNCGTPRPRKKNVTEHLPGEMQELSLNGKKIEPWLADKARVAAQIWHYALSVKEGNRAMARKFALAQYRSIYNEWPYRKIEEMHPESPNPLLVQRVRANIIRWSYGQKKRAA